MSEITSAVKSSISPMTIVKGVIGFLVIAAIFDVIGYTDLLFRPVSFLRARFMPKGA